MTALENRSSLRKLDFPFCTIEALKRLLATCKAVSHKLPPSLDPKDYKTALPNPAAFLTLSPKETELVLDIIDEFVFFTKSSLSKSRRLSSDVQELQLLQIIIEFYQEHLESEAVSEYSLTLNDRTGPLLMLTNYLFLNNSKSLSNFTILALSLKNGSALHCIGLWLQQHLGHPSALNLTKSVVENYISLVVEPLDSLENVVEISPLFALNFITSLTELYNKSDNWPPIMIIKICSKWMESSKALMRISGASILLGLARWTILHPLLSKNDHRENTLYAQLHLSVLESIAEIDPKTVSMTNKSLVLLIARVEEFGKEYHSCSDLGSAKELSFDRLGQFLHCCSASGFVQGKLSEVCSSLKKICNGNRLLKMYLDKYQ